MASGFCVLSNKINQSIDAIFQWLLDFVYYLIKSINQSMCERPSMASELFHFTAHRWKWKADFPAGKIPWRQRWWVGIFSSSAPSQSRRGHPARSAHWQNRSKKTKGEGFIIVFPTFFFKQHVSDVFFIILSLRRRNNSAHPFWWWCRARSAGMCAPASPPSDPLKTLSWIFPANVRERPSNIPLQNVFRKKHFHYQHWCSHHKTPLKFCRSALFFTADQQNGERCDFNVITWSYDWLIIWLIDWLIDWLYDWLID